MQCRTFAGDARVAEQHQLDVVALCEFVKKEVEIPPDAGERLVKRPDVDADAEPPLA